MRFIHISDTHLGTAFGKKNSPSGINQREEDICNVFEIALDSIIRLKPDLVVHSGDLFHSVRPTNRIINFAVRQIKRLADRKIPTVIISGNHDTPKQRSVGSIFSLFEIFDNLYVVHKNTYQVIAFEQLLLHAVPHCLTSESFQNELSKIKINNKYQYNVLVLHGAIAGIKEFAMGELGEEYIPQQVFEGFDYVALGHYHKHTKVEKNVYYAGSTERMSLSETEKEKGFIEVNLAEKKITFHPLPIRELIELPRIDASGLDQKQLLGEIEKSLSKPNFKEQIVRLKVINIPNHIYNLLSFRKINELKSDIFYCDLKLEKQVEEAEVQVSKTKIAGLAEEFREYLSSVVVEKMDKNKLLDSGLKYLLIKKTDS